VKLFAVENFAAYLAFLEPGCTSAPEKMDFNVQLALKLSCARFPSFRKYYGS
jgi:hypothetical protein